MTTDNEQPALDFHVPAAVSDDERIARKEIERFYAERLRAAEEAYDKAVAELSAELDQAKRQHAAWRETGEIVPIYSERHPRRVEMTAREIADTAYGRYTAAMQDLLRSAMRQTHAATLAELGRLHASSDTAQRRAAAEVLNDRAEALCRWLRERGYDLGPVIGESTDKTHKRR